MRRKHAPKKKGAKGKGKKPPVYKPPLIPEHPNEKMWLDWPSAAMHDTGSSACFNTHCY